MGHWSANVWTAIIAAFVVGFIVGFAVLRTMKGNVKKQLELEAELKDTKNKVSEQQQQLESHFAESAALLATLAEDYKKLYSHLANGSANFVPEATASLEFFKQENVVEAENKAEADKEGQPKDYSEGSSGLLKS